MDKESEKNFFKIRSNKWPKDIYEKVPLTVSHQGNENPTTMRYHFTLVRTAIFQKARSKCWQGCTEKGTLAYC
jgi:hypothetical protein